MLQNQLIDHKIIDKSIANPEQQVSYGTWLTWIQFAFLIVFIIVLPMERKHTFLNLFSPNFLDISAYLADFAFVGLLLTLIPDKTFRIHIKNYFFVILLGIFAILGFLPRETSMWNWFVATRILEFSLIFLVFSYLMKFHVQPIMAGLSISGTIQAVIAIFQFALQKSIGLHALGETILSPMIDGVAKIDFHGAKIMRAYGTFTHPNQLSAFLVVACATTLILYFTSKFNRFSLQLSLLVIILAEIATFSRAGIVSMALMLLISALFMFHLKQSQYLKRLIAIILAGLCAGIILFAPYILARVNAITDPTYNRTYYNQIGWEIFKQHPLVGTGFGSLMFDMKQYKSSNSEVWQIQPPHNFFLDILDETGVIGFALIVALFAYLLKKLFQIYKTGEGQEQILKLFLISTFISILFLMQFDHYFFTQHQTQLLLWVFAGMIFGVVIKNDPNGPMVQWQNRAFALLRRRFDSA